MPQIILDTTELAEFACEVAGAASVPFMKAHPDFVMPTEELLDCVQAVLDDRLRVYVSPNGRMPNIIDAAAEAGLE